jgi:hypothetical protein
MTLGFGNAKKYLSDPVAFKLSIASHFLKKIPKKIPRSSAGRSTLEANIDSFLFFASSVIDVIKREINDEFELFDKENVFYIHGIRKHLSDSGKQKQVKKIIASYFTTPIKENGNHWNTKQSSLWRLQVLRNKVTHGHILKQADKKIIKITYTIPQYRKLGNSVFGFEEIIKNPHLYFAQIFEDLDKFVRKTRKILSVK